MSKLDRLHIAEELIHLVLPKCSMRIWEEKNQDEFILIKKCTKFATNYLPDFESDFGMDLYCDEHRDFEEPLDPNSEFYELSKETREEWKLRRKDYKWAETLRKWEQLHYLNLEELNK